MAKFTDIAKNPTIADADRLMTIDVSDMSEDPNGSNAYATMLQVAEYVRAGVTTQFALTNTINLAGLSTAEWEITGDEVVLMGEDIDRSASGGTVLQVSRDGGGTWEIANYRLFVVNQNVSTFSSTSGVEFYSNSTAPGHFTAEFKACQVNAYTFFTATQWIGTGTDGLYRQGYVAASGAINRMRILLSSGGGTFVTGTLQVLQK